MIDITKFKILVTGANGFIGKHLIDTLQEEFNVDIKNIHATDISDANLLEKNDCLRITQDIDIVFHLAAVVGGIEFNMNNKGRLIYENMVINLNLIESSRINKIKKYIGVSSACAYPLKAPVPIKEEYLFKGAPEPTNGAYGYAKRMMIPLANAYREQYNFNAVTVIPFNAYGPGDNFSDNSSHVIPALIKKCYNSEKVTVWGDGSPTRNFLYVKDFVRGVILAGIHLDSGDPINIGTDEEISINDLVKIIAKETEFTGRVVYDKTKPNGQPRRSADISRALKEINYKPQYSLKEGIKETVKWFRGLI